MLSIRNIFQTITDSMNQLKTECDQIAKVFDVVQMKANEINGSSQLQSTEMKKIEKTIHDLSSSTQQKVKDFNRLTNSVDKIKQKNNEIQSFAFTLK